MRSRCVEDGAGGEGDEGEVGERGNLDIDVS